MTATNHPPYLKSLPKPASLAKRKGKVLSLSSNALLPGPSPIHHPQAGLNPVVDAASRLFSILAKLPEQYRLEKLQKELIDEIRLFEDTLLPYGYDADYLFLCRYILCATFDDVISNTAWAIPGEWDELNLLKYFCKEVQHQNTFFIILERVLKEPALYIDAMELIYLCLSLGYKGQYRGSGDKQFQLEQLTNALYKHIRGQRGNFSKVLSPAPLKIVTPAIRRNRLSPLFILFASACIMIIIFVSLGYLMDVISNEAYQPITSLQKSTSHSLESVAPASGAQSAAI